MTVTETVCVCLCVGRYGVTVTDASVTETRTETVCACLCVGRYGVRESSPDTDWDAVHSDHQPDLTAAPREYPGPAAAARVRKVAHFPIFMNLELLFCEFF